METFLSASVSNETHKLKTSYLQVEWLYSTAGTNTSGNHHVTKKLIFASGWCTLYSFKSKKKKKILNFLDTYLSYLFPNVGKVFSSKSWTLVFKITYLEIVNF